MLTRRVACIVIATMLSMCWMGGCAHSRPAPRPIVRENGVVLSELSFPAERDNLVLPLRKARSLLMTDAVRINGKPAGWMIIDTGAGWTCIDHSTARLLGIGEEKFWKSPEGEKPPNGMYRIDVLEIGGEAGGEGGGGGGGAGDGMALRNHVVAVIDLSSLNSLHLDVRIAGVIGADVLAATPFTLDAPRRQLIFHRRATFRPPARAEAKAALGIGKPRTRGAYFDANPSAGHPIVLAMIHDVQTAVLLDTGSAASIALQPWFTKAHPKFLPADAKAAGTVVGAAGANGLNGRKLVHARIERFGLLGAWMDSTAGAVALVGDDMHSRTAATVGQPFLSNGRLTFDYAGRRMWATWRRLPRASASPATRPATRHTTQPTSALKAAPADLTLSPHPL